MADYTNVPDFEKKITPDGKTYRDLQELADHQKWGTEPMIPGNIDPKIEISKFTENTHYWLTFETPFYDKNTGNKISKPRFGGYSMKSYNNMMKKNQFSGYDIHMIHDPTKTEYNLNGVHRPKPKTEKSLKSQDNA